MELIENERPMVRDILDQYELKDIYNVDETGLRYTMQVSSGTRCDCFLNVMTKQSFNDKADHFVAKKELEGPKQHNECLTPSVGCNGDGSDKLPF